MQKHLEETLSAPLRALFLENDITRGLAQCSEDVHGFICVREQFFVSSKANLLSFIQMMPAQHLYPYADFSIEILHESTASGITTALAHIALTENTEQRDIVHLQATLQFTLAENGDLQVSYFHVSAHGLVHNVSTTPVAEMAIRDQALDLFSRRVAGGILCVYYEPGMGVLPLYSVNDSMLNYLNYTVKSFHEKYTDDILPLFHPSTREVYYDRFFAAYRLREDVELQLRVKRRDGSYLHMLSRIRFSTLPDGRKLLCGLFLDNTAHMELCEQMEAQAARMQEQAAELAMQNESLIVQRNIQQRQARELAVSEECFRIAARKAACIVFDCDLTTGNIMRSSIPQMVRGFATNINNDPPILVNGAVLTAESVPEWRRAFDSIKNGASEAECTVHVVLNKRETRNLITMTGILNTEGQPVRVIGMIENIPER